MVSDSLNNGSVFIIDGQEVPFHSGQTVLQAALAAGLAITHLCYRPELEPIGSCRLCLVEVSGRKLSACTLPATEGLEVQSDNASLRKLRKSLVTLLLAQGNHTCIRCERTGDCRLQESAASLELSAVEPLPHQDLPPSDDSHPEVALNRSRCILCGICIQASRRLDGKNIFSFVGKGKDMLLSVDSPSGFLQDSAITAEDYAVRLCPVGALTRKQSTSQPSFASFDFFDGMGGWGE